MSRILFSTLALAAMASVATTAIAQDAATTPVAATAAAVTPKVGQVLRDANGRRLAPIESIQAGAVFVIMDMRMYRIPTSTLSMSDKGLMTSLTRSDLH